MLRVDHNSKKLQRLDQRSLPDAGWKERDDLQRMIRNSSDDFFAEMGEELLLIGEEIRPAEFVDDRIDLLAIDRDGSTVVIELKRGSNKLQLLQALSYAAMVSEWETDRIHQERQRLTGGTSDDAEGDIESFLLDQDEELNQVQRVILMAEDFDYEVLITAEWLTESYELDIRCYRIRLSIENSQEFLNCTCIYPPPEITQHATKRGKSSRSHEMKWSDWDEALAAVKNSAVADFFRRELSANRENYLRKRILHYRVDGERRLWVAARSNAAYVWQGRRFEGDIEFWQNHIGEHIQAEPIKKDRSGLRFFLSSREDFDRYSAAIERDFASVEFLGRGETPDDESSE